MSAIGDSNPLTNDPSFLSYFCPFSSKKFDSCEKFGNLTSGQKVVTIAMTIFATLLSLPILGLGGLAVLRAIVEKYTIGKLDSVDPESLLGGNDSSGAAASGSTAEKVSKIAADDMCLGFNSNNYQEGNKKILEDCGLRMGIRDPLKEAPKPKSATTENMDQPIAVEAPVHVSRGRSNSFSASGQGALPANFLTPSTGDTTSIEVPVGVSVVHKDIKDSLAADRLYLNKLISLNGITPKNGAPIQNELSKIENSLYRYLTDAETEMSIASLRSDLVKVALIFNKFKKDYEGQTVCDNLLVAQALERQVESMIRRLPTEEVIQGGFITRLRGAFQQSEGKEISWKIQKYEAVITNLIREFIEHFGKEALLQTDLSASWANVADPLDHVRTLYQILISVPLKNTADRYNQPYLKQIRKLYNDDFLPKLRQFVGTLLETPTVEADVKVTKEKEHLYKICEFLFTQINLEVESFETLGLFDQMGGKMLGSESLLPKPNKKQDPLIHSLNTLYSKIHATPYSAKVPLMESLANSLRGQLNRDFDPYRQGNPLHVLYQLKIGEKTVKVLGMGTPTSEDIHSNVSINPEFLGMLQSYKREGKKHLYVSNQDAIPKTGVVAKFTNGDETNRSNILLDLQNNPEYNDTYYAIELSKNSQFYSQQGPYKNQSDSTLFKNELYKQVFELGRGISGNYIPDSIKSFLVNGEKNRAKEMIEAIHREVFGSKTVLSEKKRCEFIELFYDNLIKVILVEKEFDSANLTCKDQIDRGAGSNAKMYSNAALVEDMVPATQTFSDLKSLYKDETVLRIASVMLVRALYVRKRPPIKERFERFCEGFEFGLKHKDKLKNLHKSVFKDIKIIPMGPEKKHFNLPPAPPASLPAPPALLPPAPPASLPIESPPVDQNPPSKQPSFVGRAMNWFFN